MTEAVNRDGWDRVGVSESRGRQWGAEPMGINKSEPIFLKDKNCGYLIISGNWMRKKMLFKKE